MAIYNVESEGYTDNNESMTLEEAYDILGSYLNEARREDKEIAKDAKKGKRFQAAADIYRSVGAHKAADDYEKKANKLNDKEYVRAHNDQKNAEYYIQDGYDYHDDYYDAYMAKKDKRLNFEKKTDRPAIPMEDIERSTKYHHNGISEKQPGTILDAQKKLNKLKEACLTILESLECEED